MAKAKRVFKTTKKVSGSPKNFRKWADWQVGDIVIGEYVGTHTDQFDKECTMVKVADAQFQGKKGAKEAAELVGKVLVLNSAGKLDKARDQLTEGDMIQVTYNGMGTIEKGKYAGKDSHDIEVDLVEEEGAGGDEEPEEETEEPEEEEDFDL